jgi:hypothetical protein
MRTADTARWAAIGAAMAVTTGSTPIGVALVATVGAVVGWLSTRRVDPEERWS